MGENLISDKSVEKNFLKRNKEKLGLGVLVVYVLLLGLGTIGEIWEIEWILDLPLFRPPGKY
ncbi:MAG: hypothetical protein CMH75_03340 [Nitrospina sp.]|nr:hypothetical protein [Nitrospina sp.]|tara:strand:+ start:730 stop:915 length:186 start_codon:yes stop_codon:yes gene_type:complete